MGTNDAINDKIIRFAEDESDVPDRDLDEQGNSRLICLFQCGIISATVIFYALTITGWVFLFEWFVYVNGDASDCSFEQAMVALLIVFVLLMSILPPALQNGSVFCTSIVSIYCTYLVYNGLESSPHEECNYFAGQRSSLAMWLGIFVTTVAISYTGFSVSRNQTKMSDGSKALEVDSAGSKSSSNKKKKTNEDDDEDINDSNYNDDDGNDDETENMSSEQIVSEKKANVTFHLCMAFASIYMAMLYSGWGDSTATETSKARGWTSVAVNLSCVVIVVILYGWTIVAPKICPGRFEPRSEEDDDDRINMDI